ncbi:unnamed protein product [Vitrella brassicaformis CCMP3155]|uniref:Uncharacterized protein n=1 Tax=Vitrella brassicaformis (strain CCMP3155) TaxID=1169540 RepID=A0A0G4ENV5_VITBC|nr:unnamed protein product [Vitrella brassicaformis CCMP3155]|eukprot:CEL99121.1 unnamed protein product [Vitrella brassicaformis CCMP3155]
MTAIREQLLPRVQVYRLKQAQVNSCIDQLLWMDTAAAAMAPLMVAKVSRQFAAVSDLLAELADTINSTIALTRHSRTQARLLHISDIPASPMSVILALSDLTTVSNLKSTARPIRNALRPIVRRLRLPKAIERARVGGVVQFDDQLSHGDVMKAMWVMEEGGEGGWGEVGDTLSVAEHCGYCQLPVTVGAADLQTHATKAWMLVGRYVALRRPTGQHDGTLELFRHNNNEVRIIRNEPNFTITLNPPLPLPSRPVHPFSQHPFTHHAKTHDPPVRSCLVWQNGVGWATVGANNGLVYASASSMLKRLVLRHRLLAVGGFIDSPTTVVVDRSVRGGHLDRIMTQSQHAPLNGCSHVMAYECASGWCGQAHRLTSSDDPFISWIFFIIQPGNNQDVHVTIRTSEAPAAGVPHDAPFTQRFPRTAAKVRRVLGPTAAIVLDGQAP